MSDRFGSVLKEWRAIRRVSQLDLALLADVSARHISFLETGRSQASRGMVLRLCDELQMPPVERNRLLAAAGFSPAFAKRDLDDAEVAPLRQAMQWMLDNHAPYPAMALDRHWGLVAANQPAQMLLAGAGIAIGSSVIEALLDNDVLRAAIENLQEVERFTLARLRTELSHLGQDPVLEAVIARLQECVAELEPLDHAPLVLPTRYRMGDQVLSLFSTMGQFGGVGEVAFSELRIELMFPADDATRQAFFAMAAQG